MSTSGSRSNSISKKSSPTKNELGRIKSTIYMMKIDLNQKALQIESQSKGEPQSMLNSTDHLHGPLFDQQPRIQKEILSRSLKPDQISTFFIPGPNQEEQNSQGRGNTHLDEAENQNNYDSENCNRNMNIITHQKSLNALTKQGHLNNDRIVSKVSLFDQVFNDAAGPKKSQRQKRSQPIFEDSKQPVLGESKSSNKIHIACSLNELGGYKAAIKRKIIKQIEKRRGSKSRSKEGEEEAFEVRGSSREKHLEWQSVEPYDRSFHDVMSLENSVMRTAGGQSNKLSTKKLKPVQLKVVTRKDNKGGIHGERRYTTDEEILRLMDGGEMNSQLDHQQRAKSPDNESLQKNLERYYSILNKYRSSLRDNSKIEDGFQAFSIYPVQQVHSGNPTTKSRKRSKGPDQVDKKQIESKGNSVQLQSRLKSSDSNKRENGKIAEIVKQNLEGKCEAKRQSSKQRSKNIRLNDNEEVGKKQNIDLSQLYQRKASTKNKKHNQNEKQTTTKSTVRHGATQIKAGAGDVLESPGRPGNIRCTTTQYQIAPKRNSLAGNNQTAEQSLHQERSTQHMRLQQLILSNQNPQIGTRNAGKAALKLTSTNHSNVVNVYDRRSCGGSQDEQQYVKGSAGRQPTNKRSPLSRSPKIPGQAAPVSRSFMVEGAKVNIFPSPKDLIASTILQKIQRAEEKAYAAQQNEENGFNSTSHSLHQGSRDVSPFLMKHQYSQSRNQSVSRQINSTQYVDGGEPGDSAGQTSPERDLQATQQASTELAEPQDKSCSPSFPDQISDTCRQRPSTVADSSIRMHKIYLAGPGGSREGAGRFQQNAQSSAANLRLYKLGEGANNNEFATQIAVLRGSTGQKASKGITSQHLYRQQLKHKYFGRYQSQERLNRGQSTPYNGGVVQEDLVHTGHKPQRRSPFSKKSDGASANISKTKKSRNPILDYIRNEQDEHKEKNAKTIEKQNQIHQIKALNKRYLDKTRKDSYQQAKNAMAKYYKRAANNDRSARLDSQKSKLAHDLASTHNIDIKQVLFSSTRPSIGKRKVEPKSNLNASRGNNWNNELDIISSTVVQLSQEQAETQYMSQKLLSAVYAQAVRVNDQTRSEAESQIQRRQPSGRPKTQQHQAVRITYPSTQEIQLGSSQYQPINQSNFIQELVKNENVLNNSDASTNFFSQRQKFNPNRLKMNFPKKNSNVRNKQFPQLLNKSSEHSARNNQKDKQIEKQANQSGNQYITKYLKIPEYGVKIIDKEEQNNQGQKSLRNLQTDDFSKRNSLHINEQVEAKNEGDYAQSPLNGTGKQLHVTQPGNRPGNGRPSARARGSGSHNANGAANQESSRMNGTHNANKLSQDCAVTEIVGIGDVDKSSVYLSMNQDFIKRARRNSQPNVQGNDQDGSSGAQITPLNEFSNGQPDQDRLQILDAFDYDHQAASQAISQRHNTSDIYNQSSANPLQARACDGSDRFFGNGLNAISPMKMKIKKLQEQEYRDAGANRIPSNRAKNSHRHLLAPDQLVSRSNAGTDSIATKDDQNLDNNNIDFHKLTHQDTEILKSSIELNELPRQQATNINQKNEERASRQRLQVSRLPTQGSADGESSHKLEGLLLHARHEESIGGQMDDVRMESKLASRLASNRGSKAPSPRQIRGQQAADGTGGIKNQTKPIKTAPNEAKEKQKPRIKRGQSVIARRQQERHRAKPELNRDLDRQQTEKQVSEEYFRNFQKELIFDRTGSQILTDSQRKMNMINYVKFTQDRRNMSSELIKENQMRFRNLKANKYFQQNARFIKSNVQQDYGDYSAAGLTKKLHSSKIVKEMPQYNKIVKSIKEFKKHHKALKGDGDLRGRSPGVPKCEVAQSQMITGSAKSLRSESSLSLE